MKHLYAIRHIESQKFLILDTGLDYCDESEPDIYCEIDLPTEPRQIIWTTQDLEHATFVRSVSARDAYCSSPQYPLNHFQPEQLEVVDLITEEVVEVPIMPSELEIFDVLTSISRYSSDSRIEELKSSHTYCWGDYQRYLKKIREGI